jgi:tryptophanyl-tRNA synthetase
VPDRKRIFSGIQPTGSKHLGNYIGAIRQYVEGQDRGEAIYCIVDLHATTVPFDPADLRRSTYDTAALLIAAGLDPDRCIFFRQADVVEHTDLCWLLCSVTSWGDLNRMHQWKEKRKLLEEQRGAFVSAGLFFYPVLQAADVLLYRAEEVPVGEDQKQHVELMREVARRFNERFGDVLVAPEARIPAVGARIMDLQDPSSKMATTGGTEPGTVLVLDEPDAVRKKVKSAVTDSGTEIRRSPEKAGIANLIEILAVVRGVDPAEIEREYRDASGYAGFKDDVAEALVGHLAPVRQRYGELRSDEGALEATLAKGAERARSIASPTLADVREAMGVGPPSPRLT